MAEVPQKDVVYIDVEDDITAIIGKLKTTEHNIVALVPPKRIGVLQSAVNLRLLSRAAEQHDKRLVLITNNHALTSLAAAAQILVAKNLQSKPEMGEIAALDVDNGEEIIDGAALPVGEHAHMLPDDNIHNSDGGLDGSASNKELLQARSDQRQTEPTSQDRAGRRVRGAKVPNFNSFRKKLVLIMVALAVVVGFFVWAIWFAPHATITITTHTSKVAISQQATLGANLTTDASNSTIKAVVKTSTEDATVTFAATGTKDAGDKATGTVKFSTTSSSGAKIAAGTTLTSSAGLKYTLDNAVTVPAATLSFSCGGICAGEVNGTVTAAKPGTKYNGDTGALTGTPAGISAVFTNATTGGTDKTIPAVTQDDLDKAIAAIGDNLNKDAAKKSLIAEFGDGYKIIDGSFSVNTDSISGSVKVGDEASSGQAQLKGAATYTLYGIANTELTSYLDSVITQQIDNTNQQKIYSDGIDSVNFQNIAAAKNGITVSLTTNGEIGPKIDESQVKTLSEGKNYGQIQQNLTSITGVSDAETSFSPFWVTHAPKDPNKISVEFKLNEQ